MNGGLMYTEKRLMNAFPNIIVQPEEEDEFENFLQLKGVARYKKIQIYLNNIAPGKQLTYQDLCQHYRYDVKLRRMLYKLIAFLEVALKATINNNCQIDNIRKGFEQKISNAFNKSFSLNKVQSRKIRVTLSDKTIVSLFDYLENCDMSQMLEIFMLLPSRLHKEFFDDITHLEQNLKAAKEVRNAVFHHNILLGATLKKVWIYDEEREGLKANIENLILLSPKHMHSNLKCNINECVIIDEKKPPIMDNQYRLLGDSRIFFDEVGL